MREYDHTDDNGTWHVREYLICSLTGMPSRSLIARRAAFWPGLIQKA